MANVDVEKLQKLVEDGYLTGRPHPTADLVIWNYTPKTQYERYWTEETRMCRGLITTSGGDIVARPFPKFFNLEEHQGPIPLEKFKVTKKMDGSLGILYFANGKPAIATRGSFTSDQAKEGTRILHKKLGALAYMFNREYTYLFEIIYPANRIVVDYGNMEDLVLLAVIETETGHEFDIHDPTLAKGFPELTIVKQYDGIADIDELRKAC